MILSDSSRSDRGQGSFSQVQNFPKFKRFGFLLCPEPSCRALEFPGCRDHKQLYSRETVENGRTLHVGCSSCQGRHTDNLLPFMKACRECRRVKAKAFVWQMQIDLAEGLGAAAAGYTAKKLDTCLIHCKACKATTFPLDKVGKLCTFKQDRLYDASGRVVSLDFLKAQLQHVYTPCRGTGGDDVVSLAVKLPREEASYLTENIGNTPKNDLASFDELRAKQEDEAVAALKAYSSVGASFSALLYNHTHADVVFVFPSSPSALAEQVDTVLSSHISKPKSPSPPLSSPLLSRCTSTGSSCRRIRAHKLVLAAASEVFKAMFYSCFQESRLEVAQAVDEPLQEVVLKEVDVTSFELLLVFLYTNRIKLSVENVVGVYVLADMYCVSSLLTVCTRWLRAHLNRRSAVLLFRQTGSLGFQYMTDHLPEVLRGASFLSLQREELALLVQSSRISIDEVSVVCVCA